MDKLNKRIGALGGIFLVGGFLLVFGAVGGMENPDQANYFWAQIATAAVGLLWMWVGARLVGDPR
jgi:hypothetical protein